ncbi:uncharacterized protein LOC142640329 [Castanea sativa]|uniref:uncharacterized protein LOC142640329 n=1 Tax=Castanea sativa TaxID=21020 RepID=UPI003F64A742
MGKSITQVQVLKGTPLRGLRWAPLMSSLQPLEGRICVPPGGHTQDRGYDVRRVMVDQGSRTEIMYPDLYRGLGLKPEDLTTYDSPLVGFDGKMVIPMGHVKLPMQTGLEVVEVNFIVVDAYSPYTAIVVRPWLHATEVVPSTLHLKVKYPFGDLVEELIGSQSTTRQCMVAIVRYQSRVR